MKITKRKLIVIIASALILSGTHALVDEVRHLTKSALGFNKNLALPATAKDVLDISTPADWFYNGEGDNLGTWSVTNNNVIVDAFDGGFAMEGATHLTKKGFAYGAFEFETLITIQELNDVQNPMVGIIPWYLDSDNYMFVQLKFTDMAEYLTSPAEIADGYAVEKILFSGRYEGEAKYYTATSQQENTTFDSLQVASLGATKVAPTAAGGHLLKVRFENNSATATSYKVSIFYNDVEIGSSYAYFYNAVAKNLAVGFMGQDVKATFSNAYLNDFHAENNNSALARDWKEKNDFTYRMQNGVDVWDFQGNGNIAFTTDEVKEGNRVVSRYRVTGTNLAGYDTNRGFTVNPHKETDAGLPQNYELSASFKRDETPAFSGQTITQGFGLLAWYKDDMNFVDVTFRITTSGSTLAPSYEYEVVLFGWIEGSSSRIGRNVYRLPSTFNPNELHKLTVAKKSTGFYVYLDEGTTPILEKKIKGTSLNYAYGYEGYNAKFTATPLVSRSIYESYDEISVLDQNDQPWRVSGKTAASWVFAANKISIDAKETTSAIGERSYLIGASDISDRNMSVIASANVELGAGSFAELMLSPYLVDDDNFARIGLVWKDGKTYARIIASTFTEADIDEGDDPSVTLTELEIANLDLSAPLRLKASKVENILALYVNDSLVYGKEIADIDGVSESYGVYVYNAALTLNSLETDGYKKWTENQVGDWTTSGIKFNAWTITEEGYLAGDATYEPHMIKDDEDGARNYAIKENPYHDSYDLRVEIKATAQSEAQDRVGVMMWYVDEENFMLFFIDMWRADSTVPRTTVYGKLEGQTLPVTYNHGGWLPEGDHIVEGGLTQTEASQVTNWHTIHVRKQGNTFTCYVDNNTGYISYTVEAGLPSTVGKTLYSGIYTLNDAVLVRSYDVTPVGGFVAPTLPAAANNPFNEHVEPPVLGTYQDKVFTDEFGEFVHTGEAPVDPGDNDTSEPGTSEPTTGGDDPGFFKKPAGIILLVGGSGVIVALLGTGLYMLKKKKRK